MSQCCDWFIPDHLAGLYLPVMLIWGRLLEGLVARRRFALKKASHAGCYLTSACDLPLDRPLAELDGLSDTVVGLDMLSTGPQCSLT